MARHPWLDPSPYSASGGPTGILLIHGFTGAPTEVRPLGQFLAENGHTVLCPLLPGHGSEPEDLNRVRWQDWAAAVDAAYHDLAGRTRQVFVAGLSLGALLALHLAAHQPAVCGLLLFAPALRLFDQWKLPLTGVVRYVRPLMPKNELAELDLADPEGYNRTWCYEAYPVGGAYQLWRFQRTVGWELSQVSQPILIFQGRKDGSVRPDSPRTILAGVRSTDSELIWLDNSGHNLLVDAERQAVFERCLAWIEAQTQQESIMPDQSGDHHRS